jgi:signal transduction histidine kinase
VLFANSRFSELLDVPHERVVGAALEDFLAPDEQPTLRDLLRERHGQREFPLRRADGSPVTVRFTVSPLPLDGAGAVACVVTDLTMEREQKELRQTQAALRESEARLRDADRRKDEFLATLAHELRNPLAPIRNAIEILRLRSGGDADVRWAQDVIDRQVQRMARLVDELMDLSRITRGQLILRRARISLAQVIEAAVETSQPLITQGAHRLSIRLPAKPVQLDADLTRLAQALANILNNAAKYTDPGGQIAIHAVQENGQVVVSIKDSGIGIPSEVLPQVFDMFTQVDRTLARSQAGLGVGLSLVRRLIEMHGGEVDARSEGAGRGSEFIVRLPVAPSSSDAPGS